jgi:DNA phosphorothioation-dependent restriction protein DptH
MSRLTLQLAKAIREHVAEATLGQPGTNVESRFVFHGPPIALLQDVLSELSKHGGINLTAAEHGTDTRLPVLLPVPGGGAQRSNPPIGESGLCSDAHLLDIRDTPGNASFVALIPPGLHINASLDTTTAKLGIKRENNALNIPFDQWWSDSFVQHIIRHGLHQSGLSESDAEDAMLLAEQAAGAWDHIDGNQGSREAAWQLIERLYSLPDNSAGLSPGQAVALVFGFPPMDDGNISSKVQTTTLTQIAEVMAEGFRTAIERLIGNGCQSHVAEALQGFLNHARQRCDVPTTFASATTAYYVPNRSSVLQPPPTWWTTLTIEQWLELLDSDPPRNVDDLEITCANSIHPATRGQPAVVWNEAVLEVSSSSASTEAPLTVALSGGSLGKESLQLIIPPNARHVDKLEKLQRTPTTYRVEAAGRKATSIKVISLANWAPGIFVTCRTASKASPPKKAKSAKLGAQWEATMSLPGSGRYEFLILASPETQIVGTQGITESALDAGDLESVQLEARHVHPGEHMVEAEADVEMTLVVTFLRSGSTQPEKCRIFITCEEAKEEGCRSEFDRLIRANRVHLDKSGKAVVQLDRNARLSSLQAWLLEERSVSRSFLPIAIADDYADTWAPPVWTSLYGPILSTAQFLRDPRPDCAAFIPPERFTQARCAIADRIRSSTVDHNGLVESAPLGAWMARDAEFRSLVEQYLDAYTSWLSANREIACWVDTITVYEREGSGRTLARVPDAVILSPLHPLRLAWHCLAQQEMHETAEGRSSLPCPAASVLDPDCIPDAMTLSLQSPGAHNGIEEATFVSLECNSDYWSVLWHGKRLSQISNRTLSAPFDDTFGLIVGGISTGFSPAQVGRALGDVTDLLGAKPIVSVAITSAGGTTDACNEGLASWASEQFGYAAGANGRASAGARFLEIYDTRDDSLRPDDAVIANLAEDTGGHIRWFTKQPDNSTPDLGIIAQLDSVQPDITDTSTTSPLAWGALIRHRVRRQLQAPFISESRQARPRERSGDGLPDKVIECILAIESSPAGKQAIQFAPNVHAVTRMLEENRASFVAVSSSAVDPACFLSGSMGRSYLWDYDLPAYSARAGDTSGYYLLSQVRESDREALSKVLELLPKCKGLSADRVETILLEVARRGIPTVRGLSGDDTGATGDLGLFIAVRMLQDQFRAADNVEGLVPVLAGREDSATMALIIPVDPFRGYLADLARSLGRDKKETSLSRPDLLVVGIRITDSSVNILLTPIEVKCRQGSVLSSNDAKEALGQAKALSALLHALEEKAGKWQLWKIAYQHLLLSMIGFGLRVYSQHPLARADQARWADYHERIAATIVGAAPGAVQVEDCGRLVIVDASPTSECRDIDGDSMPETIAISNSDAGLIAIGDAAVLYEAIKAKVGHWKLLPETSAGSGKSQAANAQTVHQGNSGSSPTSVVPEGLPDEATQPNETSGEIEKGNNNDEVLDNTGIILSAGHTVDGFEPRQLKLNISDTRLNQLNIGVVGDLGTGKTQLLKSLIYQITKAGIENRGIQPRLLIFDYKRDYSNTEFLAATGARVARPHRLPLNLFDTSTIGESAAPWLDRFRFFADVLDKVYSGIGPVQRDKLKGAVRSAYEATGSGRQPTIYDVHAEYKRLLGGKSDSPMSIIDDLVDMEVFEPDPAKTLPFDEFMSGSVVVSLDALGQDDRSKNMLVAVMLNMFYENMLRTPKRPYVGTSPQLRVVDSYLLVDEADNIMRYEFDVLRKLLLQGREFGTGVILASQYLRHFKSGATDYREPLLTWFIHKVPNVAPAELGALGFTSDLGALSERVKTLPNHFCLYKSFDVAGEVIRGLPFYEIAPSKNQDLTKNL